MRCLPDVRCMKSKSHQPSPLQSQHVLTSWCQQRLTRMCIPTPFTEGKRIVLKFFSKWCFLKGCVPLEVFSFVSPRGRLLSFRPIFSVAFGLWLWLWLSLFVPPPCMGINCPHARVKKRVVVAPSLVTGSAENRGAAWGTPRGTPPRHLKLLHPCRPPLAKRMAYLESSR